MKYLRDYLIIKQSQVFDSGYYLSHYPDVQNADINPLWHFVRFGWKEGRNPSKYFDTDYYLSQNQDVCNAEINPLLHYLKFGGYENRNPSLLFSSKYYLESNEDVREQRINPLVHYIKCGGEEGRIINPSQQLIEINEDKRILNKIYYNVFNKPINYSNPKTFNEKIQIYKLYYHQNYITQLADKFQVRKFIAKNVGQEYLIPLIGIYDRTEEIIIDSLPQQFIIKVNHGSGWNIICWDKNNFDWSDAESKINQWLKTNYFQYFREWGYKNIKPKILIEELLLDDHGFIPYDYKIHCYNGNPNMITVHMDRFSNHSSVFLDMDWNILPFWQTYKQSPKHPICPINIEEMIISAKKLSKKIPFVRIDFLVFNGKIKIGEMTFYPAAGFSKFHPEEWDMIIGDWFDISSFYHPNDY